jgi:DNA primase
MFFGEDFLEKLTSRLDIIDVVSKYVHIERKGGNFFGLCPFHAEKTPSFSVSAEKQIYHCFGCGAGGGVINFVMRVENLEFQDAVEMLAKQVTLPLPDQDRAAEDTRRRSERLAELNADAARHFYANLSSEEAKPVLAYIKKRALKPETVKRFGLGYSKDSWDNLINAMKSKGYTEGELLGTGLAVRNERGIHDRFRNRLMFPIIDVRGRIVGFGGRVMDDSMPKYLNSSDSLIFNKSRNLYGLNFAKSSKQNRIILVEGYMDVIALHQAGFDCAVASLGTSLTSDQARMLEIGRAHV